MSYVILSQPSLEKSENISPLKVVYNPDQISATLFISASCLHSVKT